jgi:hypothetical protein
MKMKTTVLCLSAIVLLAVGCSKSNTSTTGKSAFIGNYHMHDSITYVSGTGNNNVSLYYDISVIADPAHSDRVIFNNIAEYGQADSAIVSGSLASFTVCPSCTTAREVTTASLTGNNLKLSGGYYDAIQGYQTYASGTGTKY